MIPASSSAEVVQADVDAGVLETLRAISDVDVVILPVGRDEEGRGLYQAEAVFMGKELRAAGYRVAYADPAGQRLFEVRKSAVVEALVAVGLGLLTNAAWAGAKWIVGRFRRHRSDDGPAELEVQITDARPDSSSTSWTVRGQAAAVASALERLGPPSSVPLELDGSVATSSSEFAEAGPSDDLLDGHHQQEIEERLETARTRLATARSALATEAEVGVAEDHARAALSAFASALNWAEDTEVEEAVHLEMDGAGAWVRQTFGCTLAREGSDYFQRCPVALAHTRVGLSVGGYARKRCSLCGEDLSECSHLPGVAYMVPGGPDDLGWCRVCLREDGCDHSKDQRYRVVLVSTIVEMSLEEVSIVAKPAQPDARISSMSITVDELRTALGDGFVAGMDVSCDRCLGDCTGLRRI